MTNPNDAVGTNGAYGGRTSVNAFNDNLTAYSTRGIISGWECVPKSGMTVSVGGTSGLRDVAAAMDAAGNFTTINNISGAKIDVTLAVAPDSDSRIDLVVAYVDNPPQGNSTDTDNPDACGIIAVTGTPAASPSVPNDTAIRSAITADGASGSTAYYVVLAKITVEYGTTTIDATMIEGGVADLGAEFQGGKVGTQAIQNNAVTADKIDYATFYVRADTLSSDMSYTANTNTDVQTITLPAGKWRINWAVRGFYSSTTLTTATAYLYQDSSSIQSIKTNVPASTNTESTARFIIHNSYEITLSVSATIKTVVFSANAGTVSAESSYLYAMRVG